MTCNVIGCSLCTHAQFSQAKSHIFIEISSIIPIHVTVPSIYTYIIWMHSTFCKSFVTVPMKQSMCAQNIRINHSNGMELSAFYSLYFKARIMLKLLRLRILLS